MFAFEPWFDNAHSLFLEWLVAGGFPGLCLGLSLFVMLVQTFGRASEISLHSRAIMLGLIAAYGFHSLFAVNDLHGSIYFVMLVCSLTPLGKRECRQWFRMGSFSGEH